VLRFPTQLRTAAG